MWITTREASDLTGLKESWLRTLARDGWVSARKSDGRWRFDPQVLRVYMTGDWIGVREASTKTDYSEGWLRTLARDGYVTAKMVNGFWLLHWEDLLDYCRRRGRSI
jgi:hypothetical protein